MNFQVMEVDNNFQADQGILDCIKLSKLHCRRIQNEDLTYISEYLDHFVSIVAFVSMAAQPTHQPSCEDNLEGHGPNTAFVLSDENHNHVEMGGATALQQASDSLLDLKATDAPDRREDKIKIININAARFQQQCFEEFQKEIESLKESTPDWNVWEGKLKRRREEVKKMAMDSIERSFVEATGYMEELPREKQELAASSFNRGTDAVVKAAEFVCSKMEELIGAMVDFMKGNWDKVETAYNAVKSCVIKAVEEIDAQLRTFEDYQAFARHK